MTHERVHGSVPLFLSSYRRCSSLIKNDVSNLLMPTAWVKLTNHHHSFSTRALLDSGSQHTLITAACASQLKLHIHPEVIHLQTLSSSDMVRVKGHVVVNLIQKNDPPLLRIKAFVINSLVHPIPSVAFRRQWPEYSKLHLADPFFNLPRAVNLLLGSDVLPLLLRSDVKPPTSELPGAISTSLGWVLFGPYSANRRTPKKVRFSADTVFKDHPFSSQRNPGEVGKIKKPSSSDLVACSSVEFTRSNDKNINSSLSETICSTPEITSSSTPLEECLTDIVRQFWELDKVPDILPLTPAEKECEAIYVASTKRTSSGRYVVSLPFISKKLGQSLNVATKQFLRLEQRLKRQPILREAYHEFMQDYLSSGHMELVSNSDASYIHQPYYIPHHPVYRPDDAASKLRVVFNASCSTSNGKSLNDILLTGPKLQADIATLLLRFRTYRFAFTADIRQMYRQILVRPEDRDFQRILWRFSDQDSIQSYRLNTVTYGVSSAPYLALRTLKQLAIDQGKHYPQARQVLLNSIYVDDLLAGGSSELEVLELKHQVRELLMAGGFELRKWATNYPRLLKNIPTEHCRMPGTEDPLLLDRDPVLKILGLGWNSSSDHFFYVVRLTDAVLLKRTVLSQLARIFDPLGWLTPVSFFAKIFFRRLCLLNLEWDQELSEELKNPWLQFQSELPSLADLQIPRFISDVSTAKELR